MKENNHAERVQKTLDSLDNLERAGAPPMFASRLQEKMAKKAAPKRPSILLVISRPAVSAAAMLATVVLNLYMLSHVDQTRATSANSSVTAVESFAHEYSLETNSAYEK